MIEFFDQRLRCIPCLRWEFDQTSSENTSAAHAEQIRRFTCLQSVLCQVGVDAILQPRPLFSQHLLCLVLHQPPTCGACGNRTRYTASCASLRCRPLFFTGSVLHCRQRRRAFITSQMPATVLVIGVKALGRVCYLLTRQRSLPSDKEPARAVEVIYPGDEGKGDCQI